MRARFAWLVFAEIRFILMFLAWKVQLRIKSNSVHCPPKPLFRPPTLHDR